MNRKLLIGVAIVVLGLGFFAFRNNPSLNSVSTPTATQEKVALKAVIEITPTLENTKKFDIEDFTEGTTALAMTETVAQVKKKGEGEQAFVTSIDGVEARESKKEFWSFYINGKQAEVGAGTYKVQSGDVISWKIENY